MHRCAHLVAAISLFVALTAIDARGADTAQLPPKAEYDITTPQDVDHWTTKVFGPRRPPMDIPTIAEAWKAVLADSLHPDDTPIAADASRPPVKIIYDTDIGTDVDDVIALSFALRHPGIDVRAIVTSRLHVDQRAAIVSRLLQVMGQPEIPFAPGSPVLFNGETKNDKPVDQFPFAGPADDRPEAAPQDAQQLMIEVINENPGEIWLVVVGPLTNTALLIRDHPDVAAKLKGIVMMGGEPWRKAKETNIENDKYAAQFAFASGAMTFIASDDVCMRMLLPRPDVDRLRLTDTPAAQAVTQCIDLWRVTQTTKPGPVLFDLLPLVWLIEPDLFATESVGLTVDGAVVVPAEDGPQCLVTTDADVVALHRLVMGTLTAP